MSSPAAGPCFEDPESQAIHLNRLSGGAGVSLIFDINKSEYMFSKKLNLKVLAKGNLYRPS